jgi:hypothetical protein
MTDDDIHTEDEDHAQRIKLLEAHAKELSKQIDTIHSREMKKAIMQPVFFLISIILIIVSYINMPMLLIVIAVICFILSCSMPSLNISFLLALLLLLVSFVNNASTNAQWLITPLWHKT